MFSTPLIKILARTGTAIVAVPWSWCAAASEDSAPNSLDLPVGTSEILSLGGSLIMVIGAVIVVGWLYSRTQGLRGVASDMINVIAAQALGPKERIILVEVGGKQIVLGMTAQQVQTLHVFDEPIVAPDNSAPVSSAFAKRLRSVIGGAGR